MSDILSGGAVASAGSTGSTGTAAVTPQSASTTSADSMQNFALLLAGMLQSKATALLSGSGDDGAMPGMDMDNSLLQMLMSAVSSGQELDPDFAALLLGSFSGGTSAGLLSAVSGDAASVSSAAALLPLGNKSIASWAGSGAGEAAPYNAWIAAAPTVTGTANNRSAALLNDIIGQFNVESSGRYKPYKYGSDTYCNIFVWDVTSALGAEIPHFVDVQTGEPRVYPDVEGAVELDANDTCDWLANRGREYGWREVSAEEAQAYANGGRPAVTALKNASGGVGHVQVVCPSKDGSYDSVRGVTVAQSGRNNCEYAYISSTMSSAQIKKVRYFVHE